jgi:hypothetical protein
MAVGVVFGVVYLLWLVFVSGFLEAYPRFAMLFVLLFFVTAFVLWGYLARKLWGWK